MERRIVITECCDTQQETAQSRYSVEKGSMSLMRGVHRILAGEKVPKRESSP
jgi:hypothetical protein